MSKFISRLFDEGRWRIYEEPVPGMHYVMGDDTASGKERANESVANILCIETGVQVAICAGIYTPEILAMESVKAGYVYNEAEIAVEKEFHGATVINYLREHEYPFVYFHEETLVGFNQPLRQYGWDPRKYRETAVDWLQEDIGYAVSSVESERAKALWIKDPGTIDQLQYFWRNRKSGKLEAAPGKFDDRVSSLYIANYVRRFRMRYYFLQKPDEEKKKYEGPQYIDIIRESEPSEESRDLEMYDITGRDL
jgi:hypothetical protein